MFHLSIKDCNKQIRLRFPSPIIKLKCKECRITFTIVNLLICHSSLNLPCLPPDIILYYWPFVFSDYLNLTKHYVL